MDVNQKHGTQVLVCDARLFVCLKLEHHHLCTMLLSLFKWLHGIKRYPVNILLNSC
jgi:hypothetical protein